MQGTIFDRAGFARSKLVYCKRFTEKSDLWNLNQHEHPYVELIYFLNGGARIHGNDDLVLSVFDLVIYPENYLHQEEVDLNAHQEIVVLGIEFPGPTGLDRIRRLPDFEDKFRWLFVEIQSVTAGNYSHKYAVLDHLVHVLLHYVKQNLDVAQLYGDPISRVVHFIHKNPAKRISVDDLANLVNFSSSYLNRKFKERMGETPIRYLDKVRLKVAARLLKREDLDISQVAELIGFEDPKYFSRRFSAYFGISPSQFKKQ